MGLHITLATLPALVTTVIRTKGILNSSRLAMPFIQIHPLTWLPDTVWDIGQQEAWVTSPSSIPFSHSFHPFYYPLYPTPSSIVNLLHIARSYFTRNNSHELGPGSHVIQVTDHNLIVVNLLFNQRVVQTLSP